MTNINQQQVLSLVRDLMQALGTFMVTSHVAGMTTQYWELITGVVLMLVPIIWGMLNHTQANTVATVAAMPSTETKVEAGKMTIVLHDEVLAEAAATNATPYKFK